MLWFREWIHRPLELEVEEDVAAGITEGEGGFLLRPLPLRSHFVVGNFRWMPAVLEDDELVVVLRLKIECGDVIGTLPGGLGVQRKPLAAARRKEADFDDGGAGVRKLRQ